MLINPTAERLSRMRLHGMAEAFLAQQNSSDYQSLSFEDRFGLLVDQEWSYRQNRRLTQLLKNARLRIAACMEDIDYHHPRSLDRSTMQSLASCNWITAHQNLLITGPTGIGKTFAACALANAACRHGFTVRYWRLPRLLSDISMARADGSYLKLLRQLAKTELLILDEWGMAPLTAMDCRELLEVIDDRAQIHSTLIVSQLPLENWHAIFADPTIADAVLDRLVHTAFKIQLRGESMRKVLAQFASKSDQNSQD